MRRLLLAVCVLGCGAVAAQKPAAAPVADVWEAYRDNAAAAEIRYGATPRFRVKVDSIEKDAAGFVVKRDLGGVLVRCRFRSGVGLERAVGTTITARGRVIVADDRGIHFGGCELDP